MVLVLAQLRSNSTPILQRAGAHLLAQKRLEMSSAFGELFSMHAELSMQPSIQCAKSFPGFLAANVQANDNFSYDGQEDQGEAMTVT